MSQSQVRTLAGHMVQNAMESSVPLLSVVMAIARIDDFLQPSIESVLKQTFRDFELLIVVNEKLSNRHEELLSMCAGDTRVRLLENPDLGGYALALNIGIGQSRGQYVARMDGDDLNLPTRFEQQVKFLDQQPEVMVVGCRISLIDASGKPIPHALPFFKTNRQIRRQLPIRSPLAHPALMFRKSALYRVGGYRCGHGPEDWELYLRMARDPSVLFHNLDEVLLLHRRHASQVTSFYQIRPNYLITAGFLFTEFLQNYSVKYLIGIALRHPFASTTRRRIFRVVGKMY